MSSALYIEFGQRPAEKLASAIEVNATYSPIEEAGLAIEQVAKELLAPRPGQAKKRLGSIAIAQTPPAAETPAMTYTDGRWWEVAACRGADPFIFEYIKSRQNVKKALGFCGRCAVQAECLKDDLAHDEKQILGTRGGKTQAQRRSLKRQQENK